MSRNTVWVERDENARIIRVFRSTHSDDFSRALAENRLFSCPRKDAVGEIRKQVWNRCGGQCEYCGRPITETGPLWKRMHMHEQVPKGNGGEVSLENGVALCQKCHFDSPEAHGNRRLRFGESNG